jgi:glycosyltransferase involved in cell wall biosynthesis
MAPTTAVDVLVVSLGSTEGLRRADDELQDSLRRAGASVAIARPFPPAEMPTLMLTDLVWARAARDAAQKILEHQRRYRVGSVIYSSTTAALLWPRPGAIRFDATSAGNRPGRHGLWQRPLERRRLRQAPLLLPWSEAGLREAPPAAQRGDRAVVLPVPVEASSAAESSPPGAAETGRDIAAITYAANPSKKGLDRVLSAWRQARSDQGAGGPEEELIVAGASAETLKRGVRAGREQDGVRFVGALAPQDYRELLRRARVFVCAPRREDYGIAQLEALACGCLLVSTPAPGPYAALPIARALDPRLVGEDLEAALGCALDDPQPGYGARAQALLERFTRASVDRELERLLPRLLAQGAQLR